MNLRKVQFPPAEFAPLERDRRSSVEAFVEVERNDPSQKYRIQLFISQDCDLSRIGIIAKGYDAISLHVIGWFLTPNQRWLDLEHLLDYLGYTVARPAMPFSFGLSFFYLKDFRTTTSRLRLSRLQGLELYECDEIGALLTYVTDGPPSLDRLVITNVYQFRKPYELEPTTFNIILRLLDNNQGLQDLKLHFGKPVKNYNFDDVILHLGPDIRMLCMEMGGQHYYTGQSVGRLVRKCPRLSGLTIPVMLDVRAWSHSRPGSMSAVGPPDVTSLFNLKLIAVSVA
jgi:hypothetical protein